MRRRWRFYTVEECLESRNRRKSYGIEENGEEKERKIEETGGVKE